jgi:radical SAM protein with 4Fe4S-binding SPASM domain
VITLIEEFADLGGHRVTLTGGEPFVYKKLEEILLCCRKRGIQTRLFSSGIVFQGDERVSASKNLKHLSQYIDTVMYSVYSARSETHDQVTRIPGSYVLTIEAIQQTIALGINAEIHFVPTHLNYHDLPAVVELAARLSVHRVGILRFVPQGRGKAKSDALSLTAEEHRWLRTAILDLRRCYPSLTIYAGSAYNALELGDPIACSAGITQLVIEADGRIVPCSAFSNVRIEDDLGNILTHSLRDVWSHSLYLQKVRHALSQGGSCLGCLAQKTLFVGQITGQISDPLEGFLC